VGVLEEDALFGQQIICNDRTGDKDDVDVLPVCNEVRRRHPMILSDCIFDLVVIRILIPSCY
jgi:hypothetical protein